MPYAEDAIYRRISDITISMKSTDHLQMPELITSQYEVQLSEEETQRYEELKADFILELPEGEITAANAASLTGKLSQLANGAIYDDDGNIIEFHDRKLDALEDLIEAANGKPLLVAYWFKHDLQRIKKRFDVREIKSSKDITDWKQWRYSCCCHPSCLCRSRTESSGWWINTYLVRADLVFGVISADQRSSLETGPDLRNVVIEHIITKGTIDERILKALSLKEVTQNALIDAVKANL